MTTLLEFRGGPKDGELLAIPDEREYIKVITVILHPIEMAKDLEEVQHHTSYYKRTEDGYLDDSMTFITYYDFEKE